MEITGSLASQAEAQKLWDALLNAQNWKEVIPDARKCELVGENLYEMVVKADIGPIKGDQTVRIQFSELNPPDSCNFELQNSLVKSARGSFNLSEPGEAVMQNPANTPVEIPEGTRSILAYKLDLDAGNPIFNGMLEGFKGKIKDGFDGLLRDLNARAQAA